MEKKYKRKKILTVEENQSEEIVLIKKLSKQLVYLEKKIDLLIESVSSQSGDRKRNSRGGYPRKNSRYGGRVEDDFRPRERSVKRGGAFDRYMDRPPSRDKKKSFRTKKKRD